MTEPPNLDKGQPEPRPAPAWTDQSVPPQQPAPPYANPYANPYGHPYASPYAGFVAPPDHPQTTTVLVLGIVGLVFCQLTAPFAWVMGRRALEEIDSSGGQIGGRSQVQVGYVLGIVGSVLLGLGLALLVVYAVVFALVLAGAG